MRRQLGWVVGGFCLAVLVAGFAPPGQEPVFGFSPAGLAQLRQREAALRAIPRRENIGRYMDFMAAEPHHAGSPRAKEVAEYAAQLLKSWGYETRIEVFEALLPYPVERRLELMAPFRFPAYLAEPALAEDPDSEDKNQLPTYNAYSGNGDVTAELVYANYGLPEDYEQLKRLGIDVKGKIVLTRYGRSWRGTKPRVAQEHGAAGCILYSDPRDDGYFQGDPYPRGPWRPPLGVQRGSVMDMPLYVGDPLSPGWASEPGGKRLPLEEARTLMKIPVLPISSSDAQRLLEALGGPVAPELWRGALPLTYHLGPGPAVVRLAVTLDNRVRPLYNVIATMAGREAADEWVIYGNHHDAWVNGANDPVSGAAVVLETARSLAELRKTGWQPRRTLVFALWDGEEFGLVGSTEWVEKHKAELERKAVVYFNSDTNGKGTLGVGGSPLLERFFAEVLRDIEDPSGGKSLLETAEAQRGSTLTPGTESGGSKEKRKFSLGALGAGSDYVAFYHHAGIASVNVGFSSPEGAGVYHSIYDSLAWYRRFSDGDHRYGQKLAEVIGTAMLRLADAELLPLEFTALAEHLERHVAEIRKLKGGDAVDWKPLEQGIARLRSAAARYQQAASGLRGDPRVVNGRLRGAERLLTAAEGLPGRPWYRHLFSAPGNYTGYSAKPLPGIREAVEFGRTEEASREARRLAQALTVLSREMEELSAALGG